MSNLQKVENPMETRTQPSGSMQVATASREMQEVQGMIVAAKNFPRDTVAAMDRILNNCTRPTLAEGALYEYSRGGTKITGPSIRLAEAIAQNWGNMQFGVRELDRENGVSTMEAYAWDLETNTRQSKTFSVEHWRDTKQGGYALSDKRDIYEITANQAARRMRACILGIVPGDVVDAAVQQCEETLKEHADISKDQIKKMADEFGKMGVTKKMLEDKIQRRLDSITPALMIRLRKIYSSIKDEMSGPEDWFDVDKAKNVEKSALEKDK